MLPTLQRTKPHNAQEQAFGTQVLEAFHTPKNLSTSFPLKTGAVLLQPYAQTSTLEIEAALRLLPAHHTKQCA
jgi:hypothetical protein